MTDVMLQAALDVEVQRGKIERKVALSEIADRTLLFSACEGTESFALGVRLCSHPAKCFDSHR